MVGLVVIALPQNLRAQSGTTESTESGSNTGESSSTWIQYNANVGLSTDFYSSSDTTSPLPESVQRASLGLTIRLFDQIELPFTAYISSLNSGYQQPFNQFGVSPRIGKWLRLHGGYYSARMTDLTLGDVRLFGGGAELTPSPFLAAAYYGRSQEARSPVTAANFHGTYARTLMGGRVGFGAEGTPTVTLNVLRAMDDSNSIVRDSLSPAAMENLVGSIAISAPLVERVLSINLEFAGSVFTNDVQAPSFDTVNVAPDLYNVRVTSQTDYAGKLAVTINPWTEFNLQLQGQWIGPGFVSLGYQQMVNDILDLTATPSFNLLDGRLSARFQIGTRTNNLRNTRVSPTSRTIGSGNVTAQITDGLGIDLQYSNFGMRSLHQNDTIRLQNITQLWSVTPRYNFTAFDANHLVTVSASFQDVDDKNIFQAKYTNNTSQAFTGVYSLVFPSSLSLTTTAFSNKVTSETFSSEMFNVSETASYAFFDRLLNTSVTLGFSTITAFTSNTQLLGRLSATVNFNQYGSLTLQVMTNNYAYTGLGAPPARSELQGGLQYSWGL